jgi:hypothetical protein
MLFFQTIISPSERRERATALFGEASKSKAYKLANKHHLVDVGGVPHVLTRAGQTIGYKIGLSHSNYMRNSSMIFALGL